MHAELALGGYAWPSDVGSSLRPLPMSGCGGGGGGGGKKGSPSKGPRSGYESLFCLGDALKSTGVSLGLDAASIGVGYLPGGGAIRLLGTVAVGTAATGYSAATSTSLGQGAGNFANGTLGTTASTFAILDKASAAANNFKALSALPILSYISTGLSTYQDLKKTFQIQSTCVDSGKYD